MPYIHHDDRERAAREPANPGELNFAISKLLDEYVLRRALGDRFNLRYAMLAEAISAAEGAKLEFYRRVVAPFERVKQAENGDVFRSASG